jgi:hypothetical protein
MRSRSSRESQLKVLETLCVLALASLILGFIFQLNSFFMLASFFLAIYLVWFSVAKKVSNAWLFFSEQLSNWVTRLLLSLCYYVVLTPVALLYRFFNPDALGLQKREKSYFHERSTKFDRSYFERIW